MTPIAYTGFRPTVHYYGFAWLWPNRNLAIIGVEIAPHATGFIVFGLWIGVVDGT